VWIHTRNDIETYAQGVQVYLMPGLDIADLEVRLYWTTHWLDRLKKLRSFLEEPGSPALHPDKAEEYYMVQQFAEHVAAMLRCLATKLPRRPFEDLGRQG
jgi:hypothetical protein